MSAHPIPSRILRGVGRACVEALAAVTTRRWLLRLLACLLVLWALAAVLGAPLGSGGRFLYAGRLAGMGKLPYRDFPFPHPPLAPSHFR